MSVVVGLAAGTVVALAAGAGRGPTRRPDHPGSGVLGSWASTGTTGFGPTLVVHRVGTRLAAALPGTGLDAAALGRAWLAAGASVPAVAVVAGPGPAAVLVGAVAAAPSVAARRARARQRHLLESQVADALHRIAAALRAGASLPAAVADAATTSAAPIGPQLQQVVDDAHRGLPFSAAVRRWSAGAGPSIQLAAAAMALGAEAGGGVARAIDGVAATVRERHEAAAEAAALAAQARASALLISVAPVLFAGFVAAADPAAATFLTGTPVGVACLLSGLALQAAGLAWMGRITRGGR